MILSLHVRRSEEKERSGVLASQGRVEEILEGEYEGEGMRGDMLPA